MSIKISALKRVSVGVILVAMTAMSATVSGGSEVGEPTDFSKFPSDTQVFVDRGVLYGVSDTSILRYDLRSGVTQLRYADGSVVESISSPLDSRSFDRVYGGELVWISQGHPSHTRLTECAGAANAVIRAVEAREAACAGNGGGTTACSDANALVASAFANYVTCISQY